MKNYKMNVNEYLSEETLEEITVGIGDDFGYMPFEEAEANFAFVESIKKENDFYIIIIKIENEFNGETYQKEYKVQKGSKLELNDFEMPLMCFLPPEKVPALVEVLNVSETSITLKTIGIEAEYAAKLDRKILSIHPKSRS